MDLGTPEFNDVSKTIGQITICFLQMRLDKVYALYKSKAMKIKLREISLGKKTKKSEKIVNKMKEKMQKTKKKEKVWEESKPNLENVINIACTNINDAKVIV